MGATAMLHTAVDGYRNFSDRRWRRLPRFRVHPRQGAPSVYYLTPHGERPQGGVRVAYRHVDQLNAMGINAAILHARQGFRPTWFESETPVVSFSSMVFRADDILVVPEVYGPSLEQLDPGIRVLVFNQGGYITYDAVDYARSRPGAPYSDVARLEGIMTVSRDSARLLSLAHPDVPIEIARPVIDQSVFFPGPHRRRKAFAYVTSRRVGELNQILHILRARGVDWEPIPLTGMSERQVADALRESAIFLSLSDRDGFGLPPAEAMACGCYVVGYAGGGGDEFFDSRYCSPTTSTADVVAKLESAMTRPMAELIEAGSRAAATVTARYSPSGLRDDLSTVYGRMV